MTSEAELKGTEWAEEGVQEIPTAASPDNETLL